MVKCEGGHGCHGIVTSSSKSGIKGWWYVECMLGGFGYRLEKRLIWCKLASPIN